MWIVVCRNDRDAQGNAGSYVMASSKVFETKEHAHNFAARGISHSREPFVVELSPKWAKLATIAYDVFRRA